MAFTVVCCTGHANKAHKWCSAEQRPSMQNKYNASETTVYIYTSLVKVMA